MEKIKVHKEICDRLHDTYVAKNADYGDSFAKVRAKYPEAILIRLEDKMSRLEQLMQHGNRRVKDESVEDTLLDLANYCIMELVERKNDTKSKEKEAEQTAAETARLCQRVELFKHGNRFQNLVDSLRLAK